MQLDIDRIRGDFPALADGTPLLVVLARGHSLRLRAARPGARMKWAR